MTIWTRQELLEKIAEIKEQIHGVQSYSVGTHSLSRYSLSELLNLLKYYETELAKIDGAYGHKKVQIRIKR